MRHIAATPTGDADRAIQPLAGSAEPSEPAARPTKPAQGAKPAKKAQAAKKAAAAKKGGDQDTRRNKKAEVIALNRRNADWQCRQVCKR